jgi:hypothetical protein
MKTILKMVVVVLCFSTFMFADFYEGFDTVLPAGWSINNTQSSGGGLTTWFQGNPGTLITSHSGAPNSYIAANFDNAGFGGNISDYLISPVINFSAVGSTLSFWTISAGGGFADGLQVLVNPLGTTNLADFTQSVLAINLGMDPNGYPTNWTQYIVDLGVSGSGRIAFRYAVTDTSVNGNYIGIDDVQVVPEPMSCILVGTGLTGLIARRRKLAK